MKLTGKSGGSFAELLKEWKDAVPLQFLAFHALCKGAGQKLSAGEVVPADQQRGLRELFAALAELTVAIEAARVPLSQIRAEAALGGDSGKDLTRWAAGLLSSLASLGRTVTLAEQAYSAIQQARDTERDAGARARVLSLLASVEHVARQLKQEGDRRADSLVKQAAATRASILIARPEDLVSGLEQVLERFPDRAPAVPAQPPAAPATSPAPTPPVSAQPAPPVFAPRDPSASDEPSRLASASTQTKPAREPVSSPAQTQIPAPPPPPATPAPESSLPESAPTPIPPQAQPETARPASQSFAPRSVPHSTPAPAYILETARDDVSTLRSLCEPFAKAFPHFDGDIIPLRRAENELQETSSPSHEVIENLDRAFKRLLENYRAEAQKDRQQRLTTIDRLVRWTQILFSTPYDTRRIEGLLSRRVESANDLAKFRKEAAQIENDILAYASAEPGVLVDALLNAVRKCNRKHEDLGAIPHTMEVRKEREQLREAVPPEDRHAPEASETFHLLDRCTEIEVALDRLAARAKAEWESVKARLSELRVESEAALAFAAQALGEQAISAWKRPVIEHPDPAVPLDHTVVLLEQLCREVKEFKNWLLGALRNQWETHRSLVEQLQQRVRDGSLKPPTMPATSASWSEWKAALAEWETQHLQLTGEFRTLAAALEQRTASARIRLDAIAADPRARNTPDQRMAVDYGRRLGQLPKLADLPAYGDFDLVSGELELAEGFVLRIEGLERTVREAAEDLDRRLGKLLDGGAAELRPASTQRAEQLLEGVREGSARSAANWRQLRHQCDLLDKLLRALQNDQDRLAAEEMELMIKELAILYGRTLAGPLRERFAALLEDVRRAGHMAPPQTLLRRRVRGALELVEGDHS